MRENRGLIVNLKRYPTTKDSGVDWLGEIPAHWGILRLKSSVTNVQEYATETRREGGPVVALESVESWTGRVTQADVGSSFDSQLKRFQAGDVLFGKLRPYLAKVALPPFSGLCVGEFLVLRPRCGTYLGAYLEHVLRSKPLINAVNSSTFGAKMPRAGWQFMGGMPVARPPLSEQAAIVRFVRHADRRIRRYIRSKQKLMALLEEQKQAIICQAVTGQIDRQTGHRYSAYKPTGEGWLQEVPAHWEIVALRRKWRVIDCKHVTVPFVDNGIPLASVREAQSFELTLETSNHTTPELYEKLIEGGREPRPGDLIYCRNVSVGGAALVVTEARFAMGQDVCLIRSSSENQRWLNYFLHSKAMSDQLAMILIGSTFNRINVADIKALLIAVPPVSEQDRIAAVLDDELSKIDVAIGTCRREQALVHEYRTRLISDVVTGNLDVREVAVELPDDGDPGDTEESAGEYTIEQEVTV